MKRSLTALVLLGAAVGGGWLLAHKVGGPLPGEDNKAATGASGAGNVRAAPAAKPALAPAVSVVEATRQSFVETVLVTGSVVARDEIMIAPEIEGLRIVELSAEEGDAVSKGQRLATLASETLEAQLAQSEANIARAVAAISVARSAIIEAEAAGREATAAFERARPLKQSGAISDALFDQRDAANRTAEARLTSARDRLKSAEADKLALEAAGREIQWRRSRTEIRAPVDGTVSRRNARVGAVASAVGEPLFRLVANGELELDAEVAERDLARIREGQPATVTVTGGGEARGTVRLVMGEVDRSTRVGKARIMLGSRNPWKIGAFGRGRIETGRSEGIAVPTSAVIFTTDGASVQAIRGDKVETRRVVVGLTSEQAVEIRQGLAEGDLVVAKSGSFLRDGDVVRPIKAKAPLGGAASLEQKPTATGASK